MSHQVPSYYRYVSNISIDNPGSGFSSIPTITISGGGGTGATATASIFNGQIQAVNITNVGQDYTSSPTVTVSGNGSGAVLIAELAFASGSYTEYDEKSSLGIKYTLPEFIQNDYAKFTAFIEKYFEYMDSEGNPANLLLNKQYNDIDELNDDELNKRVLELGAKFPQILSADRKFLLKNIKDIYESKGSQRSIKAYFKLIYDEEVEVYYPSKNILRASDGYWIEENTFRVSSGYNDYDALNLKGKFVDIKYYETVGSNTVLKNIQATVSRALKIAYISPEIYELVIKLPPGTTDVPGPGAQATASVTVVAGKITKINVISGGYGYNAAPIVEFSDDSGGSGASATAYVSNGEVTSIILSEAPGSGGSGYDGVTTAVSLNSSSLKSFIVDRNATTEEENILAYLDRCLFAVTSGTYSGTDAGFSIGDVFTVSETSGNNNAVIQVSDIDSRNVPILWSIISAGKSFSKAVDTITITSKTNESLDITLNTKYLFNYAGKYKDDRGKLSDVNRIQDSYKYQSYSYIIKSSIPQYRWAKRFRELMHPAGMQVFGDLIITNNLNYSPFISITTEGLNLHVFKTEDLVTNADLVEIVVQWIRAFPNLDDNGFDPVDPDSETITALDSVPLFVVEKGLLDEASISDDYDQDDYAAGLPINYVGSGVSKVVGKVLIDTATPIDTFAPSLEYNRSLADTTLASEIFSAGVSRLESDAVSTIDVLTYLIDLGLPISDTVSISDDYDQDDYAGGLPINYVGSGVSKVVGKTIDESISTTEVFERVINTYTDILETLVVSQQVVQTLSLTKTESVSASESGVISISDYAPTYFGEDYVGEYRNF